MIANFVYNGYIFIKLILKYHILINLRKINILIKNIKCKYLKLQNDILIGKQNKWIHTYWHFFVAVCIWTFFRQYCCFKLSFSTSVFFSRLSPREKFTFCGCTSTKIGFSWPCRKKIFSVINGKWHDGSFKTTIIGAVIDGDIRLY